MAFFCSFGKDLKILLGNCTKSLIFSSSSLFTCIHKQENSLCPANDKYVEAA